MAKSPPDDKEYKYLLLKERAVTEQHKLNYEKLKALTTRYHLENRISMLQNKKAEQEKSEIDKRSREVTPPPSSSKISILPLENVDVSRESQGSEGSPRLPNASKANIFEKEKGIRRPVVRIQATAGNPGDTQDKPPSVSLAGVHHPIAERNVSMQRDSAVAISQWRTQYFGLLHSYRNYIVLADAAMKNAVEQAKKECQRVNGLLEETNLKLTATGLELSRHKETAHRENETLRDELEETRLKLEEKTAQYDFVVKKMDGISFLKDDCSNETHKHLQSKLATCETKCNFFKAEFEETQRNNKNLQEENITLKSSHEEEVREMKALLVCVYNNCISDKNSLQSKYKEISLILNSQQSYVEEIDNFIKARENENNVIIDEVCQNLKKVIGEGRNALEVIEGKLRGTVSERKQLEEDLSKTVAFLEEIKKEAQLHQEFTNSFVKSLHHIIDNPIRNSIFVDRELPGFLNDSQNRGSNETISQRLREEESLEKALKRLIKWKSDEEEKKYKQETRVMELESLLETERNKTIADNEAFKTKCRLYKHMIKELKRNKRRHVACRPKISKSHIGKNDLNAQGDGLMRGKAAKTVANIDTDTNVNYLLEKHIHFGKILNTVSSPNEEN